MGSYNVWQCHLEMRTHNWGGREWVVDGENGRATYPGDWTREEAILWYQNGWPIADYYKEKSNGKRK